jgi:hypothetical protein
MAIKGSLANAAGGNTPKQPDVTWDSEGYPVRVNDRVTTVSKGLGMFHEGTVTSVNGGGCEVRVDGSHPKAVKIPVAEIQGQHDRLISKTAKEQGRKKNPLAKITEPPRGKLKTNIRRP